MGWLPIAYLSSLSSSFNTYILLFLLRAYVPTILFGMLVLFPDYFNAGISNLFLCHGPLSCFHEAKNNVFKYIKEKYIRLHKESLNWNIVNPHCLWDVHVFHYRSKIFRKINCICTEHIDFFLIIIHWTVQHNSCLHNIYLIWANLKYMGICEWVIYKYYTILYKGLEHLQKFLI